MKYVYFLFFISILFACAKKNTTNREIIRKAIKLEKSNPDSAKLILFNIVNNSKDDSLKGSAYFQLGYSYHFKNKHDSSIFFMNKALETKSLTYKAKFNAHRMKGYSRYFKQNYVEALKDHLKSLDLAIEKKDSAEIAHCNLNVSSQFYATQNYKKALSYINDAIQIGLKLKDTSVLQIAHIRKGMYYGQLKKFNKAIEIFKKARSFVNTPDSLKFIQKTNNNIAMCYMYTGRPKKAIQIYRKSLNVFKGMANSTIRTYRNIAYVHYKFNNVDSAFYYYNKALKLSKENQLELVTGNIISSKRELAQKNKMYKKALELQIQFMEYKDSLALEKKSIALEEIKKKYEEEKKILKIKEKNKREKLNYIYIFTITIIILLTIILLIERNKKLLKLSKEKLAKEIESKKTEIFDFSTRIQEKNRILLDLEQELQLLKSENSIEIKKIKNSLKNHLIDENANNLLEDKILKANFDFLKILKTTHSDLTKEDLKLIGLLKLNFSSKQISEIYNTTERAIEARRYRLRKKLNLEKKINLVDYLNSIDLN